MANIVPFPRSHKRPFQEDPPRDPFWGRLLRLILSVGVLTVLLQQATGDTSSVEIFTTAATAASKPRWIELPDRSGSKILLDTHAILRLWHTGSSYTAELLRGQAAFTMRPSSTRDFQVLAGNAAIRDIGTIFTVKLDDDAVVVTVEEGVVQLSIPHEPERLVQKNQQAIIGSAVRFKGLSSAQLAQAMSWRQDMLEFEAETVDAVVTDLNRRNRTQIEITDPEIRSILTGGSVRAIEPLDFARRLILLHPEILVLTCKYPDGSTALRLQSSNPSTPIPSSASAKCAPPE